MKIMRKITTFLTVLLLYLITFTSCNKENSFLSDNSDYNETQTKSYSDDIAEEAIDLTSKEMLNILEQKNDKIISVEENYTDKETGITGTLYTIKNDGEIQQWLKADEKPDFSKGFFPKRHSVIMYVGGGWPNDPNDTDFDCSGSNDPNCFGWTNFFVVF